MAAVAPSVDVVRNGVPVPGCCKEEFCTSRVSIGIMFPAVLGEFPVRVSVFHPPGGVGTAQAGTEVCAMNGSRAPADQEGGAPAMEEGAGGNLPGCGAM